MPRVSVVHHGIGNIVSVVGALEYLGADVQLADTPEKVLSAERLVLPGVGAAGVYCASLRSKGFADALQIRVRQQGIPLLGICVGMQIMTERLFEHGDHQGLGWFAGETHPLMSVLGKSVRAPHMGWNEILINELAPAPFYELGRERLFYFCHSYAVCRNHEKEAVAKTVYSGGELTVALHSQTAIGIQFHPERSQLAGERFLSAFLEWMP